MMWILSALLAAPVLIAAVMVHEHAWTNCRFHIDGLHHRFAIVAFGWTIRQDV